MYTLRLPTAVLTFTAILTAGVACAGANAAPPAPSPPTTPAPVEEAVQEAGEPVPQAAQATEAEAEAAAEAEALHEVHNGIRAEGQEDPRPGLAVFPFVNGGSYGEDPEDFEALEVGLQQLLLTELAQNDELRIVERSLLRDILQEQELGASGRVDPQTAARIGKLVGARYIITGVFVDLYGQFRMDARTIDVETGEIIQTETVRDERENMYQLLVQLASGIVNGADLPPLPAAVRQAREEMEIPAEAITLFSRAQVYEDRGYADRAVDLYQRIVQRFPEMIQAKQRLEQLAG